MSLFWRPICWCNGGWSGHRAYPGAGAQGRLPPQASPPAYAPPLSTPAQAARWLDAERANVHAAAGYAAAHGHHERAAGIAVAVGGFLFTRGHRDEVITVQRTALAAARQAGDRPAQAAALNQLCLAQALTGDIPAAAAAQQALDLFRDPGDRIGQGQRLEFSPLAASPLLAVCRPSRTTAAVICRRVY
jgi:hypothetical protein